tara:strand:- start:16552 stop:16971 length:420 start_codon:yes stop_codon:yes gene_type:complete
MTIHTCYQLHCTQCSRQFNYDGQTFFESTEEVIEFSKEKNWACNVKVRNGSFWDFCNQCYPNHQFLEKHLKREEKAKEKVINVRIDYSTKIIVIEFKTGFKELKGNDFIDFTDQLSEICDKTGLEYKSEIMYSLSVDYI